jgi:outer membrane cobalamin receptor
LAGVALLILGSAALAGCAAYHPSEPASSSFDRVLNETRITASHQPNVWLFLRDNLPQFSFVAGGNGQPLTIRSPRGQSSMVLTDADAAMVIVDGTRLISLDVLQQMPLDAIVRVEIQTGATGTTLQGTNAGAGVIYIHTRFGSSPNDPEIDSAGPQAQPGTININTNINGGNTAGQLTHST